MKGAIHRKDRLEAKLCILHLAQSSTVEFISENDSGQAAKHNTAAELKACARSEQV